jgi:predicted amino acid racemase
MTFKITDDRLQQLLQIEESVNCDIGAGIDYGPNLGAYLATATQYIDHDKLINLLHAEIGELLPTEDLEAIAAQVHQQIHQHLQRRSA